MQKIEIERSLVDFRNDLVFGALTFRGGICCGFFFYALIILLMNHLQRLFFRNYLH